MVCVTFLVGFWGLVLHESTYPGGSTGTITKKKKSTENKWQQKAPIRDLNPGAVPEQSYALPSELIVRGNVVIWWLASYYSADRMLTAQRADLQPRRGAVVPCVVIASERASWSSLSAGGEGETLHS